MVRPTPSYAIFGGMNPVSRQLLKMEATHEECAHQLTTFSQSHRSSGQFSPPFQLTGADQEHRVDWRLRMPRIFPDKFKRQSEIVTNGPEHVRHVGEFSIKNHQGHGVILCQMKSFIALMFLDILDQCLLIDAVD
jgi:hypothetical protein